MAESQNIEYKQSWRDEYLKWFSGFANAQGGKLFIGVDDKGIVIGIYDSKRLMDDIPNKAVQHLGLVVDVNLHDENGKHYIEVIIPISKVPISYHGIYHYRSGSTKQELKGNALTLFMLKKLGVSWEQRPISKASIDDLDQRTIDSFLEKALAKQRISENAKHSDLSAILKNLGLINDEGELLLAALLLFGKNPSKWSIGATFKIGRFGQTNVDLRFQDILECNLLDMADRVMQKLDDRYLIRPISYRGLQRIEGLEYPENGLREAILNAIIHKDYADNTPISLRVFDDRLSLWNPGTLPDNWTIEYLKGKHESKPRNSLIAKIFFMAGYIESWGRGVNLIFDAAKEYGIPEPEMIEDDGGIRLIYLKDIYNEELLKSYGITDRQIKAVLFAKENGFITNSIYQKLNGLKQTVSSLELQDLVTRKLLKSNGVKGRGSAYVTYS